MEDCGWVYIDPFHPHHINTLTKSGLCVCVVRGAVHILGTSGGWGCLWVLRDQSMSSEARLRSWFLDLLSCVILWQLLSLSEPRAPRQPGLLGGFAEITLGKVTSPRWTQ